MLLLYPYQLESPADPWIVYNREDSGQNDKPPNVKEKENPSLKAIPDRVCVLLCFYYI